MSNFKVLAAVGLLLAATLYGIGGAAPQAVAAPGPSLQPVVLEHDTFVSDPNEVVLVRHFFDLRAGESRRVIGNLTADMVTTGLSSMDDTAAVRCLDAAGVPVGPSVWAQTSLVPNNTEVLRPSLLFTAPAAGRYRCELIGYVGSRGTTMKARAGVTYLLVSDADEAGSHWWQSLDCDPRGEWPTCFYVGDPNGRNEAYLFYDDFHAHGVEPYHWTAASSATHIGMNANLELTTCGHTASCNGRRHDHNHSTVVSRLEAVQLDAHGWPCVVTHSGDRTDEIGIIPHHYNIAYTLLNVPVSTNCGSRNFLLRIYLRLVSGNPVKVDGSLSGTTPQAQTAGLAYNSQYAETTTVPSVLGMTLTAATSTIQAARLRVGSVTHLIHSSPPGTVFSQNAPGGTVQPVDSPVNLLVSRGSATVPNVLGWDQFSAIAAIGSAGLTVGGIGTVNTCVDPGSVHGQSPSGGSVVAPGTPVALTITICLDGDPK